MFTKSYVINLDPQSSRLKEFDTMMNHLEWPYERFQGVNGKKFVESLYNFEDPEFSKNNIALKNKYIATGYLTPSEIGCAMSHIALWEKIATGSDQDRTVIFEDDARTYYSMTTIRENLEGLYAHLQENNIPQPEMLYLGKALDNCLKLKHVHGMVYYSKNPLCFHAYMLTKSGAQKLLQLAPYYRPIDTIPHYGIQKGLNVMVFQPSLFYQDVFGNNSDLRSLNAAISNVNDCAKSMDYVCDDNLMAYSAAIIIGFIAVLILFVMFLWKT